MQSWLIDTYRANNQIVLWLKHSDGTDERLFVPAEPLVYADLEVIPFLKRHGIPFKIVQKRTCLQPKSVVELKAPVDDFERFIRRIERISAHTVGLYNADIKPEQMFLYQHDLYPFAEVEWEPDGKTLDVRSKKKDLSSNVLRLTSYPPLRELKLQVFPELEFEKDFTLPVRMIVFNGEEIRGSEEAVLRKFAERFNALDPDVIILRRGYALIPYLSARMARYGIRDRFHRWDPRPIEYRGGRSYWSYNQVRYQDYSVYLRGRLLVDTTTFVGGECDLDGIIELVDLSGALFQEVVARSFGGVFQWALIRLMVRDGMIVPYKEKPVEPPLSMYTMLKADRGGLTLDPKIGFHQNVAELDFTSMFPMLIYNHNISAECMLSNEGPFEDIPNLPVQVSVKNKGLIPRAIKPFLDRRMFYKKHPTELHKRRAKALKWVLVTCYGYLRYREFKLGIPTSHMAICAWAREALLDTMHLAEERGFEVVHGIVDSIFITKPGMTVKDAEDFALELEERNHIPVTLDGIFNWVVFLPSRVDPDRGLPATYFGVFRHGDVKVRGLEVRQRGVPPLVKAVQENALRLIKDTMTRDEIREKVPLVCAWARQVIADLTTFKPSLLVHLCRLSKIEYTHNIPQKIIVDKLIASGVKVEPGQFIEYIFSSNGPVLPEEYQGNPHKAHYKRLIIRALVALFRPFGFGQEEIEDMVSHESQLKFEFEMPPQPRRFEVVYFQEVTS